MNDKEVKDQEVAPSEPPTQKEAAEAILKSKRTRPVKVYMTILLIVVVALLAFSYAMQRRNSKAIADLNQTNYSKVEEINELNATVANQQADIQSLNDQLDALQSQMEEVQSQLEIAQDDAAAKSALADAEQAENDALTELLSLEYAYQHADYTACASVIKTIDENGYAASYTGNNAAIYSEITAAVAAEAAK